MIFLKKYYKNVLYLPAFLFTARRDSRKGYGLAWIRARAR